MNEKELIRGALLSIISNIGAIAGVPVKTGNLRRAIKIRETSTGFQVYMDLDQAPYAESVESVSPYWRRVAVALNDQLKAILGDRGPTRYDRGRGVRDE